MKLNFYLLLIPILILNFYRLTFAQSSPEDSFFPSAVGNTWIYDTPFGPDTVRINRDSMDSGGNKFIFYNNSTMPAYKIDSSGENVYNISNGLNLFKYQLNTDSGSAWIEDLVSPVIAARVNSIFPSYIFGEPRDVKQIGYYKLPGDTSLAEDFSSGINTSWIIYSGTFSVDNFVPNPLSSNQYSLACNQSGIIGIPCSQAYGTWQFDIYKGADENNLEVDFIADRIDNAVHPNGYFFTNNSSEVVGLSRSTSGSASELMGSADSYTAKEGTWYRITITRNTKGEFYTYIEGGEFTSRTLISVTGGYGTNPIIDTSYTFSNYFVLDLDAGDRISNIVCEYNQDNLKLINAEDIILNANRDFEDSSGTWSTTGNHIINLYSGDAYMGSHSLRIINKFIYESDFSSDEDGFAGSGGNVIGAVDGVSDGSESKDNVLKFFADESSGNHAARKYGIIVAGSTYIINASIYIPSDQTNVNGVRISLLSGSAHDFQNIDSRWTTISYTGISNSGSFWFFQMYDNVAYFTGTNNPNDDVMYLKDVHVAQVGDISDNHISLPPSSITKLQNDRSYTYSMYYKSPYLNRDTLTVNIGDKSKTVASSDTWTRLVWTFQADDSTINQPIKIYLNQADTLYIDDVSLKPVNTLFDNAVYNSEIWLADGIGEYYEYSKEKGILKTLEKCIINGHTFYTSVQDNHTAALNSFKLYQNYPNPFNPVTNINYNLPERTKVVINVYDILGREVASLVDEVQSAGFHSVKFKGEGLPSGVYIYRIAAGRYSDSKKLVLLK